MKVGKVDEQAIGEREVVGGGAGVTKTSFLSMTLWPILTT